MSKKLVIYGNGQIGEIAHFYFTRDTDYEVVAFTADREFVTEPIYHGLPVIPFDELDQQYPPGSCELFVALSYSKLNTHRMNKFNLVREKGYECASYISSKAAFWPDNLKIGANCFILENVVVQPFVEIGDNVTIWSGSHIGHHSFIGNHSFITSQVVVSGGVRIGERCFIGVNATLRDHIEIGDECVVGAGALIMASTDSAGVYTCTAANKASIPSSKIRSL
jgi:sugar O-acyltransferase (sialic acid O-acetyltransferase NeuD family)